MLNSNVLLVQVHKYIWSETSQLHCALGFMVHRCDYTWFFWRATKNPVAYMI